LGNGLITNGDAPHATNRSHLKYNNKSSASFEHRKINSLFERLTTTLSIFPHELEGETWVPVQQRIAQGTWSSGQWGRTKPIDGYLINSGPQTAVFWCYGLFFRPVNAPLKFLRFTEDERIIRLGNGTTSPPRPKQISAFPTKTECPDSKAPRPSCNFAPKKISLSPVFDLVFWCIFLQFWWVDLVRPRIQFRANRQGICPCVWV